MISIKNLVGAATIGGSLVFSVAAYAVPTQTVDGITFPVGLLAGGNQIDSGIFGENLVTAVNQISSGIGLVNSINTPGFVSTWSNGQNGVELAFTFDNYKATSVTPPTGATPGQLLFSGGNVDFFVLPAGTPIQGHGSLAADISFIQTTGALWLSLVGAPNDALGNTLSSTIPAGQTLTQFAGGQGQGPLDVAGGPAAPFFGSCTFANPFDVNGCSDVTFTTDFSSSSTGGSDVQVNGSATVKANAEVPEPMSLVLLGAGLAALGMVRGRKS